MSVTIRRAQSTDGQAFLGLVDALADYEVLDRPLPAARKRLLDDAFGAKPRFELLVAEIEGELVGYAFFYETYSSFLAKPTLWLEDIFVLPDAREAGAGGGLFKAVAHEAVRRDCGRMEWTVLTWNTLAQDFYARRGAAPLEEWRTWRLTGDALLQAGS
jgi:GNAT superfamily N-acetyltransferase